MELLKVFSPWIFYFILLISGYIKLQSQVKVNKEKLKEHSDLLTSGNGGGSPFITEPEHGKMQDNCRTEIFKEISNISKEMGEMKTTMKKGDECRSEAREETSNQLAAIRKDIGYHQGKIDSKMENFQKGMFETINPLVTKTALNDLEISHLKEKINKK